jgi:hypothetical protein
MKHEGEEELTRPNAKEKRVDNTKPVSPREIRSEGPGKYGTVYRRAAPQRQRNEYSSIHSKQPSYR